jgi:hypothetical protein
VRDQNHQLMTAYGAAGFYMHVIEDILRLHLADCSYYGISAYTLPAKPPLQKLRFVQLIDEFARIHSTAPDFIRGLHCIREARNDIVHGFITQVGPDVESEEGRDQIHALLIRLIAHERRYLTRLRQIHEALLDELPKRHLARMLERDEPEFAAHVATSDAQKWLDELDALRDPNVV